MTAQEIRKAFLDFFATKQHKIVPSAPIVNKDDPSLMFTNAGMNQFKDYFLGNQTPESRRVADTQKCLRVSGKHNDLEEVGHDGTHHTMFEMLGNWSFGDYFKEEAIAWSWELLTEVYGMPKDRIYATVFEGDEADGLAPDNEALDFWLKYLPKEQVLYGNKKDNFWEMGETGPCGPCSEIHIDLRENAERATVPGRDLVNMDHPKVIEIWNNVFIQFDRKADGALNTLPQKHVDTGMGFERLCMVLQGKTATYDTDLFTPFIHYIEKASGKKYQFSYDRSNKTDVAMRVVADHIRAVAFAIADGQLPGNTGAGYVIRRILRRAVRYYFSFLDIKKPFLHELIPLLADRFADVFPELKAQEQQVARIIEGEEKTFLNTLDNGLARFDSLEVKNGTIQGEDAFELFDTYGFPIDLTRLLAEEKGYEVDEAGFEKALAVQKARSRADAKKAVGDWTVVLSDEEVTFVGYDQLTVEGAKILKYRTVKLKGKEQYHLVLNITPFYAESGGQAGDTGKLLIGGEEIKVIDTQKENDLTVHIINKLPTQFDAEVKAMVDPTTRQATSSNHSAVHLMHAALHEVVGEHALQKGQDVDARRLRFDFSHFQKVTDEEIRRIEEIVNQKIRANIQLEEDRKVPIEEARKSGAMMLFGEKYGDVVRIITFDKDFSRELCGGTHIQATGEIGLFKITSETGVAAGIRRIEALTSKGAEAHLFGELNELNEVRNLLKTTGDVAKGVASLQEENKDLKKQIDKLLQVQAQGEKTQLIQGAEMINGVQFIGAKISLDDAGAIKNLAFQLEKELDNVVAVLGADIKGKPLLTIVISKELVTSKGLHAGNLVRELAKEIKGGGGGQPFFATAGGKDVSGLEKAIAKAKEMIK
ncbi:MAG: alanine--tRNA ligase [Saprospiraceae bacterium]|nr:MAG: alanine--tRNA ligase [Saprospiraceae bacterium]